MPAERCETLTSLRYLLDTALCTEHNDDETVTVLNTATGRAVTLLPDGTLTGYDTGVVRPCEPLVYTPHERTDAC